MISGNAAAFSRIQEGDQVSKPSHRSIAPPPGMQGPRAANRMQKAPCSQCGEQFSVFSEGQRGWNTKPHELCRNCFRGKRQQKRKGQKGSSTPASVSSISDHNSDSPQVVAQVSALSVNEISPSAVQTSCCRRK